MEGKRFKAQALTILVVLLVIIFILLAVIMYLVYQRTLVGTNSNTNTKNVTSYKECADAGYPILESYPAVCVTPDGKSFTNPDQKANENPTNQTIKVFFPKTTQDDPTKVFALNREIIGLDYSNIETVSIERLITGPTDAEKKLCYYTPISLSGASNCSLMDFTLNIEDKTATVQFCKNLKLDGDLSGARVVKSVEETLKQFSTVTNVRIVDKNGNCVGDLSGKNSCLN